MTEEAVRETLQAELKRREEIEKDDSLESLRIHSRRHFLFTIAELKFVLQYTRKSVIRKRIQTEILFWEIQAIPNSKEHKRRMNLFWNRYPDWKPKYQMKQAA